MTSSRDPRILGAVGLTFRPVVQAPIQHAVAGTSSRLIQKLPDDAVVGAVSLLPASCLRGFLRDAQCDMVHDGLAVVD